MGWKSKETNKSGTDGFQKEHPKTQQLKFVECPFYWLCV